MVTRVWPLVRYHQAPSGIVFADWSCSLCWPDNPMQAVGPRDAMQAAARAHYQDVHVPGIERILAEIHKLGDDQCGALCAAAFNQQIGPCVLPAGHQRPDHHEGPTGATWDTLNGNPGQWVLGRPGEGPRWHPLPRRSVATVEDYPAPQIPWRWLLLTLGVALVVAAAVLILADVVPWGLGVLPW